MLQRITIFTDICVGSAISFYKSAAEQGDKRAIQRLKTSHSTAQPPTPGGTAQAVLSRETAANSENKKDCIVM